MSGKIEFSDYIHIKGARLHNLKNIELKIPRNKLIVITGVSGSGNPPWLSTHYMLKVNGATLRVYHRMPANF